MIVEHRAENIAKEAGADQRKWSIVPSSDVINSTDKALEENGFKVFVVDNAQQALEKIKELIPAGAEVMNGSSTTLAEIGFTNHLKDGGHAWKNLYAQIFAEQDPQKQADLRRKALTADYYLASVQAITEDGKLLGCDQSGSRVGAFAFAAKNLLIVSGANKIVKDLDAAFARLREYAYPLENVRCQKVYGVPSSMSKIVILQREIIKGRTTVILVKEKLGY